MSYEPGNRTSNSSQSPDAFGLLHQKLRQQCEKAHRITRIPGTEVIRRVTAINAGTELDDGVGRLRLVRRQLSEIFITPVRKIDDPRRLRNSGAGSTMFSPSLLRKKV